MANKTYQVVFELGGKIKGSLGNAFGSASQKMAKLQKDLRDVSGTQKAMVSQKRLEASITETSSKIKKAAVDLALLRSKMMMTSNPTQKLSNEFNRASSAVDKLHQKLSREKTELDQIKTSLAAAGINAGNFARKEKELADAAGKAQAALNKQHQRQAQIQADEAKLNKYNNRFSTAVGVAMGLAFPTVDYVKRQQELRINANVNQLSQAEIEKTNRQLLTIGAQYGQSREDVMAAWGQLSQAGLGSNAYTVDLTKMASRAAYASGASSEDVSNAMKALYNNMNIKDPRQMYRALGILISQANAPGGQFEFRNMVPDLPQLLAQMGALGVKGYEGTATLGAMLQTLSPAIGKDPDTTNRLWNVLMKATVPETVKNFAEFTDKQGNFAGVNLPAFLDNARKNHKNVAVEYLNKVFEMTNGGDPELVAKLFQDMQALQGLSVLATPEGQRKMAQFKAIGLKDNNRTIEHNVGLNDTNPGMQAGKNWQSIVKAGQLIVGAMMPAVALIGGALGGLSKIINKVFDPDNHPVMYKFLQFFASTSGMFLSLFVLSSGFMKLAMSLKLFTAESAIFRFFTGMNIRLLAWAKIPFTLISAGFNTLRVAIIGLNLAMGWWIAIAAAVVLAGVYVWRHWDTISANLRHIWAVTATAVKEAWTGISGWISNTIDAAIVKINEFLNKHKMIKAALEWLQEHYWGTPSSATVAAAANQEASINQTRYWRGASTLSPAGRASQVVTTYAPNIYVNGADDPSSVKQNVSTASKAAADDFFKRFQDHTNKEQRLSYGF